jgi:hypothetical protein
VMVDWWSGRGGACQILGDGGVKIEDRADETKSRLEMQRDDLDRKLYPT